MTEPSPITQDAPDDDRNHETEPTALIEISSDDELETLEPRPVEECAVDHGDPEILSREGRAPEAAEVAREREAANDQTAGIPDEEEGDDDDEEGGEDGAEEEEEEEEEDEEEEDADDEPKLKYARLTSHLGPVYRNGDATSAFVVAGDKMAVGTHNGNIHVVQLPSFQSLRVYHAHAASVTCLSISPYPPPLPTPGLKADTPARAPSLSVPVRPGSRASESQASLSRASAAAASRKPREVAAVPNTPSNNIFIATSSLDGNVCVQSLVDPRDVQLRNFARPVQAVALSPDFRNDRTYLSGGTAGQLVLTMGAPMGKSTSTTTGATAQAAGWLGSMVGQTTGRDTVLHSGEGTITTIKWSLTGKYVAWLNEHGIKIMRSRMHLDTADAEDAWKRIGHIDRPQTDEWDTMATVWKGRAEWVDEQGLESDEGVEEARDLAASAATEKLKQQQTKGAKQVERLLVGWGGNVWIIHIHAGGTTTGKTFGERSAGRAEIVRLLRMDCIVSGLSLYTQNLLLVLAYALPEEEDEDEEKKPARGHAKSKSTASTGSEPSGGIRRRQNNQPPELRLIDLASQAEVDKDGLSVSRFERLNASDYHLGVLPAQNAAVVAATRGTLETLTGLGSDMWNAAINPKSLFSSAASVRSRDNESISDQRATSVLGSSSSGPHGTRGAVHPNLLKPGAKVFIHSPYDCILATKRDLGDHLDWLLEREQYQQAYELIDEHPEIMATVDRDVVPGTPDRTDDFYEETGSMREGRRDFFSSAERKKRNIGELWIQQLINAQDYVRAGQVCGVVLRTPDRWEKWVWTFANAGKLDDMATYMPTEPLHPPIPATVYEVVLSHYLERDKVRFRDFLDLWSPDLFDINTITTALEKQLKYREVREDGVEGGEVGRDWRIVMESLARLHEENGRSREALKCYIKLQDADSAMRLIKNSHLVEAIADDIASFIGLRVPPNGLKDMTREHLQEATREPITLLVDEAQHGLVKPDLVVAQLQRKELDLYTYFYLRGLWRGEGLYGRGDETRARLAADSQAMVDRFADLAVHIFSLYDQELLGDFLKTSTQYSFELAVEECEQFNYMPELVYLYSKTGQMKRALYLIIDRLQDVSRAIVFAKEQEDPDLWEDLLDYSMDKPRFIRALLDEVGTAIDPITLVRRIPEGLEIPGLREGLKHMMKEHEIQFSISSGVARVLRSEVAAAQTLLRNGQRKGVKFEVVVKASHHVDVEPRNGSPAWEKADGAGDGTGSVAWAADADSNADSLRAYRVAPSTGPVTAPGTTSPSSNAQGHAARAKKWRPGHCAHCHEAFTDWEAETLVGFACSHVFHLQHLLEFAHPGQQVDPDLLHAVGHGETHRVVGAKVTHARLLKDRIEGGCPVCKKGIGETASHGGRSVWG